MIKKTSTGQYTYYFIKADRISFARALVSVEPTRLGRGTRVTCHAFALGRGLSVTVPRGRYWAARGRRLAMILRPFPVYYMAGGRDCDCVEYTSPGRASCGLAYLRMLDRLEADAEGPTWAWVINRKEYGEARPSSRDRILEAFENGSNYNV